MELVYISTLVLFFLLTYITYKYHKLSQKYFEARIELNKQDLDYHLKKIKQAGYEFTIKPAKQHYSKKLVSKISSKSDALNKSGNSKTFNDLVP